MYNSLALIGTGIGQVFRKFGLIGICGFCWTFAKMSKITYNKDSQFSENFV
jgi:hypothetical protein